MARMSKKKIKPDTATPAEYLPPPSVEEVAQPLLEGIDSLTLPSEPDAPTKMDPPAAPLPVAIDMPPPATTPTPVDDVAPPAVGKFSDGYRAGLAAALAVAIDEHDSQSTKENGVVWANCARHIADGIRKLQGAA